MLQLGLRLWPHYQKCESNKPRPFRSQGWTTGDHIYCCDFAGKKFYVLLFTCAVIRAVHLELVESLSCESTVYIMALRRSISRRGMPSVLVSDNAKCFWAANDRLVKVFGPDGPKWRFIAPHAPWWGGWWERLVGSITVVSFEAINGQHIVYTSGIGNHPS